MTKHVVIGIPIFMILIAVELVIGWRSGRKLYRFHDSITDLGCGMSQLCIKILTYGGILWVYAWFHSNYSLWELSADNPWTWVFGFFAVDVLYYWWHRLSHEVNFMWAVHVVHHQSEDYNLAVALRQAWFSPMTYLPFNLILAVAGVPLIVFLVLESISLLYQFWLHTQLIKRMGPLERVMNTPSHHRVHHGINPGYLDKNYAAILIIWDRMFGSFAEEKEPVVYGTVKPFESWNVVWANFAHWAHMWRLCRLSRTWSDRIKAWFARPEWVPEGQEGYGDPSEVHPDSYRKFTTPLNPTTILYIGAQFGAVYLLLLDMHMRPGLYDGWRSWASVAMVIGGLATIAGLLQQRMWAVGAEWFRLLASSVLLILIWSAMSWMALAVSVWVLFAGLSVLWVLELPRAEGNG
jgi:sterol desaturase/sphingolipid hydroxylase (fatty acid hydroxylase superfamily)